MQIAILTECDQTLIRVKCIMVHDHIKFNLIEDKNFDSITTGHQCILIHLCDYLYNVIKECLKQKHAETLCSQSLLHFMKTKEYEQRLVIDYLFVSR